MRRSRPSSLPTLAPTLLATLALLSAAWAPALAAPPPPPGPLGVHALTGARIVAAPGRVIASGTVVIRDGVIEAAGAGVEPPPDARVWDLEGATVFAGLIEPYTLRAWPASGDGEDRDGGGAPDPGAGHSNPVARPEREMAAWGADASAAGRLREAGYTTAAVAPSDGVLRGWSAVVNLGDGPVRDQLLVPRVAQNVALDASTRSDGYPESLMGRLALTREAFLAARWYAGARETYGRHPAQRRPPHDASLEALEGAAAGRAPVVIETEDLLGTLRAGRLAAELGLDAWLVGSGEEYQRLEAVAALGRPLLLPVAFPEPPESAGDELAVELEALRHWKRAPGNPAALAEAGVGFAVTAHRLDQPADLHARLAEAIEAGLPAETALAAVTTEPARLLGLGERLGTVEAGRIANLTVAEGELFAEETEIREVWIDGRRYPVEEEKGKEATEEGGAEPEGEGEDEALPAAAPGGYPATSGSPVPEQPSAVLVRNATVWTSGPDGRLEGADLLVRAGRIAAVGPGLEAPAGAVVIDATGKHVTPGLIDAHSHTAVDGSVNEGSDVITAEVRIADVLDPNDAHLYRQLGGGLTAANVLHGSANAIGGQSAVIKLRWGALPEELLFEGATPGVKFALGENPKQSNWRQDDPRYPQTRMGVEQAMVRAFEEALAYRRAKAEAAASGGAVIPPRPDLRFEALLEILDGRRHVHSHAYRADEMLMLLGLSERYGFIIDAFQHSLEAYKIADELAERGVGASTFSDWWAYKYEVVDAIPYNGAILLDRGVVTSFNSDSSELARRLNTEAAKAVRYGGVPQEEALKLVTLYPAVQLGVADRVGSLEPGKHADFVIWSGHPLSTYTYAAETWIDGRKYFDRAADLDRREEIAAEREALLAEAKGAGEGEGAETEEAEEREEEPEPPEVTP